MAKSIVITGASKGIGRAAADALVEWRDKAGKRHSVRLAIPALNAPFLEPCRNMDQQIINETPYRRQHSARRRVNQVKDILRSGPFRQDAFNKPLF